MDELDIFILKKILLAGNRNKEITAWTIAKEYSWDDKNNIFSGSRIFPKKYYDGKTMIIKFRLKKMERLKIIEIIKGKRNNYYFIDEKKVCLKKYKYPDEKVKDSICMMIEGKWNIYQL